jgi:hypothetical protein
MRDEWALARRMQMADVVTRDPEPAVIDRPCVDCLDHSLAAERAGPAVPGQVAFWLVALVLTITMLGTTLPTPL